MNIAEWGQRGKEMLDRGLGLLDQVPRDVLVVAIVVLSASAAFGLGYLTGKDAGRGSGISVTQMPLTDSLPAAAGATSEVSPPALLPAGGQYVASKTGTRYYLPWCGGARTIKDENKIWFDSKAQAEAAGYAPAANCKGI